jgi:peptidoglycan/xylan/chitin deacetylase (PgdA/CDA1 family)
VSPLLYNLPDKLRNLLKYAAVSVSSVSLAQQLFFYLRRRDVLFLMYHGIIPDDEELQSTTSVRESEFVRQLNYLSENFACVSIEEALSGDRDRKRECPSIVVTFDDGYANNYTIALPLLERRRIPAVIYVATGNVCERKISWADRIWTAAKKSGLRRIVLKGMGDSSKTYEFPGTDAVWQRGVHRLVEDVKRLEQSKRDEITDSIVAQFQHYPGAASFNVDVEDNIFAPLSIRQLEDLSAHPLITIGSHSHCHSLLNRIPIAEARESIRKSKETLERITGRSIEHFSYPNGNYSPEVIDLLKEAGFKSAVSIPSGVFHAGDDPYTIKRIMIGPHTSMGLFKTKLTGFF